MCAWRPWLQLHSKAAPGAVQRPHNTTSCPVPALSIRGKCLAALVLLFCNLSHGFCQSSWKQVAVGGAEQLSCSPWECGRSAIHLARVEPSSICLCVRHLHSRAVGATDTSCLLPRNHFNSYLPQTALQSAKVPNCKQGDRCQGWIISINLWGAAPTF